MGTKREKGDRRPTKTGGGGTRVREKQKELGSDEDTAKMTQRPRPEGRGGTCSSA